MPIFRLTKDALQPLQETLFSQHGIKERSDLQRLLRANIAVVAPDVLMSGVRAGTVCRIRQADLVAELLKHFDPAGE